LNDIIEVNERVQVIAVFKKKDSISLCVPAKMYFKNQEIIFSELCFRHPVTKGRGMVHVFDMTDGVSDYRLEFDSEKLTWTLRYMLAGQR
jgi:hypothetical protein